METMTLNVEITQDHILHLPEYLEVGEVEITLKYKKKQGDLTSKFMEFLESLDGKNFPRRSVQDINDSLRKERNSWD